MAKGTMVSRRPNSEKLVIKDNALIMASYSLTVEEQRLVLAGIFKAQEQKTPLKSDAISITLTVPDYMNLYGVKQKTAYKSLKESSDRLYERTIRITETENGAEVKRKVRWLQEQADYSSGKVKLVFSQLVSKHLRDIVNTDNAYRLSQATQLRSQSAVRIFEILNWAIDRETQEGEWEVSLEDFRDLLDLEDAYPRWADLKDKVITPCVNQINKNTSLKVNWEVAAKEGKRISKIRFYAFEGNQLSLSLS